MTELYTLTDYVFAEVPERPRVDYRRVFAWLPVETEDGRIWLNWVWKMTVNGQADGYAHKLLPIGWHR